MDHSHLLIDFKAYSIAAFAALKNKLRFAMFIFVGILLSASEENLIQVAESVASIALAEAEAEGDKNDDNDENLKSASELVEQEVIQAVEEVKLGDTGVSGAFAKEVLQGKEIVFVIGNSLRKRIFFSLGYCPTQLLSLVIHIWHLMEALRRHLRIKMQIYIHYLQELLANKYFFKITFSFYCSSLIEAVLQQLMIFSWTYRFALSSNSI